MVGGVFKDGFEAGDGLGGDDVAGLVARRAAEFLDGLGVVVRGDRVVAWSNRRGSLVRGWPITISRRAPFAHLAGELGDVLEVDDDLARCAWKRKSCSFGGTRKIASTGVWSRAQMHSSR